MPFSFCSARRVSVSVILGVFLATFTYAAGPALASTNAPLDQWPLPPDPKVSTDVLSMILGDGWYAGDTAMAWRTTLNNWYQSGQAAGLVQDAFRSYDNDHATINSASYPQMRMIPCTGSYTNATSAIYDQRATFGLQSYGAKNLIQQGICEYDTAAVIDYNFRMGVRTWYNSGGSGTDWLNFYRGFYENNFFFIAPACGGYEPNDKFPFLVPYFLHSVGYSGSDAQLMRPFIYISAALPVDLKTRILRRGLLMPTIMYVWKKSFTGDIRAADGHIVAWTLPVEGWGGSRPTPQLDRMLNTANALTHIPPVAKFAVESAVFSTAPGTTYTRAGYYRDTAHSLIATLRQNEKLVLTLDLSSSLPDDGYTMQTYYAAILRGPGTVEYLNPQKSRVKITIPWTNLFRQYDLRTDVLLLANDGTYDSAPAYVSVKHIQPYETSYFSLAAYPAYVDPVRAYVFYNNSSYDGNDPAANSADDNAIAADKTPLVLGQAASIANYTSYDKGLNGIMFDIPNVPGTPVRSDFLVKTGTGADPTQWTTKSGGTVTLRRGAGYDGTDRVTLVFADGAILNKWVQITVKATANTGIWADDTFYFGNAIGETGNASDSMAVSSADAAAVRADPHKTLANPAGVTNKCDINRDQKVNTVDELLIRANQTTIMTELKLFAPQ